MLEVLLINPETRNPFPFVVVRDRKVFAIADGERYLVWVLYNGSLLYQERTSSQPLVELTVAVNGFDTLIPIRRPDLSLATLDTPGLLGHSGKIELDGFRDSLPENEEFLKFKGHFLRRGTLELQGVVWACMHAGEITPLGEKRQHEGGKEAPWLRGAQNGRTREFPRELCAVEFDEHTRLKERGIVVPITNDFWPLQAL